MGDWVFRFLLKSIFGLPINGKLCLGYSVGVCNARSVYGLCEPIDASLFYCLPSIEWIVLTGFSLVLFLMILGAHFSLLRP